MTAASVARRALIYGASPDQLYSLTVPGFSFFTYSRVSTSSTSSSLAGWGATKSEKCGGHSESRETLLKFISNTNFPVPSFPELF